MACRADTGLRFVSGRAVTVAGLISMAAASVVTGMVVPAIARLGRKPNYHGVSVGRFGGLGLVTGAMGGWAVFLLLYGGSGELGIMVLSVAAMAVLGLIDDCWGLEPVKGLKGHLRQWLNGKGDTALGKAAGGLALGVLVGLRMEAVWWDIGLDVLAISLSANALNLLDLRPGRALKGFGLGLGFLFLLALTTEPLIYLFPLLGAALVYAPYDLREKAMLGDAGANALGVALGVAAVLSLSWPAKAGWVVALAALHWYAERGSISSAVERVGWLRLLDRLGRAPI